MRYVTRRRRDAGELELAEKVGAVRHLALTLVYLDEHTGLVKWRRSLTPCMGQMCCD